MDVEQLGIDAIKEQQAANLKFSSDQSALIPEDRAQIMLASVSVHIRTRNWYSLISSCIRTRHFYIFCSFQALQMLMMSGALEIQAAKLRFDALQVLLGTVSGSATSNLWKLLEYYFGVDEDAAETKAAEAASLASLIKAQKAERDADRNVAMLQRKQDQEAVDAPASSTTSSESQPKGAAKRKMTLQEQKAKPKEDSYPNKCDLVAAQLFFPTSTDTMHQTGVSNSWIGERLKLGGYKGCYPCMGVDCDYVTQTRAVLCSHVRRVHLGIALGCTFCPEKAWWQGRYWSEHMDKTHSDKSKFETISSGDNVVSTTEDAEMYVTEETIVIPAPGEVTVKQEAPEPPDESDDKESGDDQPSKRMKLSEENIEALEAGAECIRSDPVKGPSGAPLPKIIGIRYKKKEDRD